MRFRCNLMIDDLLTWKTFFFDISYVVLCKNIKKGKKNLDETNVGQIFDNK